MGNAVFEAGKANLELARKITLGMLDSIPDGGWCQRPFPGANHALWTLGHLAWADDEFLSKLKPRDPVLDPAWWKMFEMGSTPVNDRDAYPAVEALRAALASSREELLTWFASMDERQLSAPLPKDWLGFAPNYGTVMSAIAWHEGFHAGELAMIRKHLKLDRVFG